MNTVLLTMSLADLLAISASFEFYAIQFKEMNLDEQYELCTAYDLAITHALHSFKEHKFEILKAGLLASRKGGVKLAHMQTLLSKVRDDLGELLVKAEEPDDRIILNVACMILNGITSHFYDSNLDRKIFESYSDQLYAKMTAEEK